MASVVFLLPLDIFAALGAESVRAIEEESFVDERNAAAMALEAVCVPVTILKRHKFRLAKTCNRFTASKALLGKQLTVAVGTVWLLIL